MIIKVSNLDLKKLYRKAKYLFLTEMKKTLFGIIFIIIKNYLQERNFSHNFLSL